MKQLFFTIIGFLLFVNGIAQKDTVFVIDLGKEKSISYDVELDQHFKVKFTNTLPDKNYIVSYEYVEVAKTQDIAKLILGKVFSSDFSNLKLGEKGLNTVAEYENAYFMLKSMLDTIENEVELSNFSDYISKTVENLKPDQDVLEKINEMKNSFKKSYDKDFKLSKPDKELVLTISRSDNQDVTWKMTITPKKIGEFQVSYGFHIISPCLTSYPEYYSKSLGNDEYQITSKGKPEWNEFVYSPSVNVIWYRNKKNSYYGISAFNPTMGFGLDAGTETMRPSVFLGFSFSVQRLINFSLGMAMHQTKKIDSEFDLTKIYTESYSRDMIMSKIVYAFNPAFSITFNFSKKEE